MDISAAPARAEIDIRDIPVPLSREDMCGEHFDRAARVIGKIYPFQNLSIEQLRDSLARCMGYVDYAQARNESGPLNRAVRWIESDYEMPKLMAWRGYLAGAGSLADLLHVLQVAMKVSGLSYRKLSREQGRSDYGERQDDAHRDRRSAAESPRIKVVVTEVPSALRCDGMLVIEDRTHDACIVANQYWTPYCGKSVEAITEHIRDHAGYPLYHALRSHQYRNTMPPGLDPISLIDEFGVLLGVALEAPEFLGYLQYIYPPDQEAFLRACEDLWHRRPLTEPPPLLLPKTVFVGEYRLIGGESEMTTRSVQPTKYPVHEWSENNETRVLSIRHGRLTCGFEFEREGEPYTRPLNDVPINTLVGVLGFSVSPTMTPQKNWLQGATPYALSKETAENAHLVCEAERELERLEIAWIAADGSASALGRLGRATCAHATPTQAFIVVHFKRTNLELGFGRFDFDGLMLSTLNQHPFLSVLPREMLVDYLNGFWGEYCSAATSDHPHLLPYIIMRNLGLDPFDSQCPAPHWLGIFRLIRIALSDALAAGALERELPRIRRESYTLMRGASQLSALVNEVCLENWGWRRFRREEMPGYLDSRMGICRC